MMTPEDRYKYDRQFAILVDTLYCAIEKAAYTPTEIREAAMLAQIMYEECHPRRTFIGVDGTIRDADSALDIAIDWKLRGF